MRAATLSLVILATAVLAAFPSAAQAAPSREDMETTATALPAGARREFADYWSVTSANHLVRYYFTKPGAAAYPYAAKITVAVTSSVGPSGEPMQSLDVHGDLISASSAPFSGQAYAAANSWLNALQNEAANDYRASLSRR
jgi:hypothetical protein